LRVGDLADRGELVLRDHDAGAAAALERQRADDPADALRDGRRYRHLVGVRAKQSRERGPRCLGALDPVGPFRAALVPAVEVLLVGGTHAARERALRARVQVGRVLEDRELAADRASDTPHRSYCSGRGMTPSCWRKPSRSLSDHFSASFPSSMRCTTVAVMSSSAPVVGMPGRSSSWRPYALRRVTTLSPSAIWSSITCRPGV